MEAFHIDDGVSAGEVVVAHEEGLVKVAAGVVADVEDKVPHPLVLEFQGRLVTFLVGGAGEFPKPEVADCVRKHKRGVNAVEGNLSAGYFKRDYLLLALDCDGYLCAGGALYAAHHTVLGEFHAGNHFVIYFEEAVSGEKAHFLRRTAGDYLQNYSRVIGDVELYADTVKIAGQFLLRGIALHGRHIHGMGIKAGKDGGHRGIRRAVFGEGVHVVTLNNLEDGIQFLPVLVFCGHKVLGLPVTDNRQSNKGAEYDAHYYLKDLYGLFTH